MQRKALKQLNKVTQWTNEKVFSGEKTEFASEFEAFEEEIEPLKIGVERLHATSVAFHDHLSKLKPSADPYPPSGSGKDKIRVSEALGIVMLDYGNAVGGSYGDALIKYGHARCKLAELQDHFSSRLEDGYINSTKSALGMVEEYKAYRKKMESRRLTLDSALHRLKSSKKENPALEEEVEIAQQRLQEATEDTQLRMEGIKEQEEEQFAALADLLDSELEYFSTCKQLVEDLQRDFPGKFSASSRPRAKSNASARTATAGRTPTRKAATRRDESEESPSGRRHAALRGEAEDSTPMGRKRSDSKTDSTPMGRKRSDSKTEGTTGRDRSDSAASAGKGKRFMSSIGSIGSFGMRSGMAAASAGSKMATKAGKSAKGGFGKTKYDNISDEERRGVTLESDDESLRRSPSIASRPSLSGRARSQSVVSVVAGLAPPETGTTRRRALTSPPSPSGHYVKVLFDYEGKESDELTLKRDQIIEVKQEISEDWLLGECEGSSGIFPKAFTEVYIPTPVEPIAPRQLPPRGAVNRRSMPPPSSMPISDTDSEAGIDHDHDHDNAATSLWSAQQPTPTSSSATPQSGRSRAGSLQKKAAPPPPPSRRTTSSNNLASIAAGRPAPPRSRSSTVSKGGDGVRSPTSPRASPYSSAQASPFVGARSPFDHSDDEDNLSHEIGAMHVR